MGPVRRFGNPLRRNNQVFWKIFGFFGAEVTNSAVLVP